ncbi:MAG: RNA methyltransferase [Bacteroidales bacterium]|jgi:tRNA G18 (ribose-2'-O)-methylase SpoU|nr:RNA methyltransferase [Bacteroidales bacterium]
MNRLQKLSMEELHRKTPEEIRLSDKIPVVVVSDNIRSLHNIGSIFRTCDAFLVTSLLLCGISATPPHREIHKSALGAEDTVDWQYFPDTLQAVEHLKTKGYSLWGIEQTRNSTSLENFRIKQGARYAFIFGNEVRGIAQEVINCCEGCLEIPQFGAKHSFNVSVCAGIVLWECYRQILAGF